MNDISPIAEPTDLEIAKAKVAELEAKRAAAWKGHYEKFPGGRCSVEQRAALQAVQAIEYDLKEARQRLDFLAKSAEGKRLVQARDASADLPKTRLFEVRGPDGRVLRHRANSAGQLRTELKFGYEVISECFGYRADGTGGVVVSLDANVPNLLDGILQAFGPQL